MNKFLVGTNEQGKKVAIITHQHQSFGVDNFQDKFHIPEISSHGVMDVNAKGVIVIDKCSAIYNPNDGVFIEGLFRKGLMFRSELKRRMVSNDIILCNFEFLPFIKNIAVETDVRVLNNENQFGYYFGVKAA